MNESSPEQRLAAARQRLRGSIASVQDQVERTGNASTAAVSRMGREKVAGSAFEDLVEATAFVVDDLMNLRNSDAWSTSFGFLVNFCLAGLAVAQIRKDARGQGAMLLNLSSFSRSVGEQFAENRLPVQRWSACIAAMGVAPVTLESSEDRHPLAGSLQKHFRTVRDTGLALTGVTEFYALHGGRVYTIRPA